jgi:hypothetical protein
LLTYSNVINSYPAVWSRNLVWGDAVLSGNMLAYNQYSWSRSFLWGQDTDWATPVVPIADLSDSNVRGGTIVWDVLADTIVWDVLSDTIVWDVLSDTIVWDVLSDTIVWDLL